jgi:hypothetical protein
VTPAGKAFCAVPGSGQMKRREKKAETMAKFFTGLAS